MLSDFLDPSFCSLKICGVTRSSDAADLVDLGVQALGVNFWPKSKRYLTPSNAMFLKSFKDKIARVGVFVNAGVDQPRELYEGGYIDAVQLHGDEPIEELVALTDAGVPVIRSLSLPGAFEADPVIFEKCVAVLLDAHAPGVYGGTGETIDWSEAARFIKEHETTPVILAGGITPENASEAMKATHPAALDVASGSEISPGVKDVRKVEAILAGMGSD